MNAVDSPARCHTQPAHVRDDPHSAPAATAATSLRPTQASAPVAGRTLTTAAASAEERSVASVPPAARAPQLEAAAAQVSAVATCL